MHERHCKSPARRHERGTILFISLILLAILSLLGVTLARLQTTEEQMARNDQNHALAVQAAEATLRYAESNINGLYYGGQFASNSAGLYQFDPIAQPNAYITSVNGPVWGGTGALTYAGPALGVFQAPQFIIENMPPVAPQCQSTSMQQYGRPTPQIQVYRITALSVGGDGSAKAELQSIYSGTC